MENFAYLVRLQNHVHLHNVTQEKPNRKKGKHFSMKLLMQLLQRRRQHENRLTHVRLERPPPVTCSRQLSV